MSVIFSSFLKILGESSPILCTLMFLQCYSLNLVCYMHEQIFPFRKISYLIPQYLLSVFLLPPQQWHRMQNQRQSELVLLRSMHHYYHRHPQVRCYIRRTYIRLLESTLSNSEKVKSNTSPFSERIDFIFSKKASITHVVSLSVRFHIIN